MNLFKKKNALENRKRILSQLYLLLYYVNLLLQFQNDFVPTVSFITSIDPKEKRTLPVRPLNFSNIQSKHAQGLYHYQD